MDKFTYLGSGVSSTKTAKAWTAIDRLSVIWKSDLTNKIKHSFFQAAVVLILLYGCTTWVLTKRMELKLNGNYTRMLQAILNKSWRQYPTKHLPPITKTIMMIFGQHSFVKAYLIEQYRTFLSTYFCLYPFKLLYQFYDIPPELVDKPSIINWFPSTFDLVLGHHQG